MWIAREDWETDVIPSLIAHTPRATGWHVRSVIEVLAARPLKPNPCGCGACSVCGMYGLAPKPVAVTTPAKPAREPKAEARTLFDEVTP